MLTSTALSRSQQTTHSRRPTFINRAWSVAATLAANLLTPRTYSLQQSKFCGSGIGSRQITDSRYQQRHRILIRYLQSHTLIVPLRQRVPGEAPTRVAAYIIDSTGWMR